MVLLETHRNYEIRPADRGIACGDSGSEWDSRSGVSVFAWRNPYEYALVIIILRFGWLAGIILPLACAALASSLFRLSKRADDVYAGSYAFSVVSYFSVKLFLNLMSCFVAYLDRAELPLGGNRYQTAVDVVLLVSVIAFMRKTQGKKPVVAEKETETPMKGQTDMENSMRFQ